MARFVCPGYSGEEGRDGLGFFLRKENDGTLLLELGAERNWYLNYTGSEIDFSLVKQSSTYTAYVNGEVVLQNEKFSCDPHEGALLIGCQERLPGGERYNFSHGHVLNLEIYERALDAQTIADWSPEALPEPQLPLGLLVEKPEPVYTLPEQFLGGGEGYDQGAYMDTDLRLLDEAGTRFTLLASVTPEHIDGDKVFFSCFSEEADITAASSPVSGTTRA